MQKTKIDSNHSKSRPLSQNPNWKGGRTITSHGYVLIKSPNHPHADMRGYIYEHRLVMEKMLGRYLNLNEIVHHKNGNGLDNSPENIELAESVAEHKFYHRKRQDLKSPNDENPIIYCVCGCGNTLKKYDSHNRPRKYITGHFKKARYSPFAKRRLAEKEIMIECACGCGNVINKYDAFGRERKFVSGHNRRKIA